MKLAELKAAVYKLAQVETTKQLKAQYEDIKPLNMRYKVSWEKALTQLRSVESVSSTTPSTDKTTETNKGKKKLPKERNKTKTNRTKKNKITGKTSTTKESTTKEDSPETSHEGFTDWLKKPHSEFSELFEAADTALEAFGEKLAKGKQMTKKAIAMTSSLDEFAEATVDEAKRLAKATQQAMDISKKADLN